MSKLTTTESVCDRDMFTAYTTLGDPDLPNAVEPVVVLDTTDTRSDEEMTDQTEAATLDLPGPKPHAADLERCVRRVCHITA